MEEVAPGVHRWTASHPEWEPDAAPQSPGDWPQEVGSVAYEAPEHLVLVDPLVPDTRWAALDALVKRHQKPAAVLTTVRFHSRSRDAVAERYHAALVYPGDEPPPGVRWIPITHGDEAMVWLEAPRALVPGDRLIGDDLGGLRMCPASWLGYLPDTGIADMRVGLRRLLDLPIALVLVSHGEPVLRDGRTAVAAALGEEGRLR